jgi:hypothetical protein
MTAADVTEADILDLGDLEGRVLVFGGAYGNLEATRALRQTARQLGVEAGRVLCTGDLVAYGADPQATVDLVRQWGCPVLMGNCEEALAADADDCGCNFNQGSTCAALSVQWFTASRRDLDAGAKRWMGTLPRRIVFTLAGRRLAAVHGGAGRINRWIFASTPEVDKAAEIDLSGADGVIAGHAGIPFTDLVGDRLWHNSGALGMPANDGTPRVWFSVLTPARDGIAVTHHALQYDYRAAAAKMRARGYPIEYADGLISGLWPSCDILPTVECDARGRALVPRDLVWSRAQSLVSSP